MKKSLFGILIICICLFVVIPVVKSVFSMESLDKLEVFDNETDFEISESENAHDVDNIVSSNEETTCKKKDTEVSIAMVGDILMHDYVQTNGQRPDGTYNYDHIFVNVLDEINEADVAIANQEVIIGGDELGIQNYPRFNCRHEIGDALVNAGFSVILHATNHTLDQGISGVINCMDFWDNNYPYIKYLGIHRDETSANDIYVYTKDDFRIAMLNYTYGTNGASLSQENSYLMDFLDEEKVKSDLQRAKELADCVIVFPHWGTEYSLKVSDEQRRWAQIFADGGASVVIGTHPHVVEPIEWVEGTNGNQTLIYYSIGNFVSAQDRAEAMLGAMARVTLTKDENDAVSVKEYDAIPLVTHRQGGTASVTTYKLMDYTQELSAANRVRAVDASFSLEKMNNIWNDVMNPNE